MNLRAIYALDVSGLIRKGVKGNESGHSQRCPGLEVVQLRDFGRSPPRPDINEIGCCHCTADRKDGECLQSGKNILGKDFLLNCTYNISFSFPSCVLSRTL